LFLCPPVHLGAVEPPSFDELPPDEDVLGDRQVGQEPHLLVDEADADGEGVPG
jgi:hypothetical protein